MSSGGAEELLEIAVKALGGTRRDGQVAMARAVDKAMRTQHHLAVQAGTGTGKSLAYLVPAIRHAQQEGSTVVVSTATIALQRQLINRDLPRLADALEEALPHRPTFAIQKGRSNYLCLNRFAAPDIQEDSSLIDESELSYLGRQAKRVQEWAQNTETGDRDDLNPGVSDSVWRSFSVTATECLGASRCPYGEDCFAEAARRKTYGVDVLVTNHALLAIDAMADSSVLPEHEVVIIDEAHELDGRITSVAGAEITPAALNLAARRAVKLGSEGRKLEQAIADWESYAESLDEGRWTEVSNETRTRLTGLHDELCATRRSIEHAPEGEQAHDPERYAERYNLTRSLRTFSEAIQRMMDVFDHDDPAQHEDVVWLGHDLRRGTVLNVAPLSIAELLAQRLFSERTVVLTSATLALGGRFDVMARAWGLSSCDSLDVGSPFNPAKSGILYAATSLPEPKGPSRQAADPAVMAEMETLITAAGGRTLGLFSSKRAAELAAEHLRPRLPFDILLQGENTTGALIERFSNEENTCLFGTLTLWQGVDVPGPALSLVIIDRIPFPRPDDPLLQARKEAADAQGRNGFMEVAASHAALLMAQGAGRLLRSVNDRGVVAVLDPRLATRRYGNFLKDSMPPFWPTTNRDTVCSALRRLINGER